MAGTTPTAAPTITATVAPTVANGGIKAATTVPAAAPAATGTFGTPTIAPATTAPVTTTPAGTTGTGATAPAATGTFGTPTMVPTPEPTIGSAFAVPGDQGDTDTKNAGDALATYYSNEAAGIPNVDENAIRQATISQFQNEIDATNSTYADALNNQNTANGRLQAKADFENTRNGSVGSTEMSSAQNQGLAANKTITDDKAAAIAKIMTTANQAADAAITAKTTAAGSGLAGRLAYYQGAATRKAANATAAATNIYQQGFDPTTLTPAQLAQVATAYGLTPADITAAFPGAKATGDAAKAAAAAKDAVKVTSGGEVYDANGNLIANNPKDTTLATGAELYAKQPDGSFKMVAQGEPKTTAAKAGAPQASDVLKIQQGFNAAKGADGFMDPYQYAQEFNAWTAAGYTTKAFLAAFPPADYVNPAADSLTDANGNPVLPSYLQPKASKTAATVANPFAAPAAK